MLMKLVLVTCLVVVAGRPKVRGARELLMHDGGMAELIQTQPHDSCTIIVMMDGTLISSDIVKDLRSAWKQRQALTIFMGNVENRNTSITEHLSRVISLARQIRQLSWCTIVFMVSHDANFLIAFAESSLKGRLLVWSTRLVVVTRLDFSDLQALLPTYWTFSMMNTVFLNMEASSQHLRYGVYTYLPYTPAGSQVVKIAFWTPVNSFKYLSSVSFFQDKFNNFHGAAVNVTAKPFMPYWGEEEKWGSDGSRTTLYRGSDYRLLETVASTLNFTIRVLPTSSWAEVTSLVEEHVSLMAPVIYMVLTTRLERYDFTFPYEQSHASFAVAKPGLEARWKSLYYPLAKEVWIAVAVLLFLIPFLLSLFIRAGQDGQGGRNVGIGAVYQDMVGMLLGQSTPRRLSGPSSSRVVVAAWLVFAFIIAVAYCSNLTASLTLPKYPPRPETLQEIVDTVDMVTLPPYGEQHRNFFSNSESPLFQALGRLMSPGPSLIEGLRKALMEKSSHTEAKKYLQYVILDKFTEADGSTRLYVSRESIFPSPSAWPIPHDAPYKANLDRWIVATLEAGLYEKWIADLLMETKLKSQRRQRQRLDAGQEEQEAGAREMMDSSPILTLSHTQGAFIILLLGLCLATLAFTREFCCLKMMDDGTE